MRIVFVALLIAFQTSGHLTAQDNTKIVDPNTNFHRLYVVGNGDNSCEDESFKEDQEQLKGELEKAGNQAAGSTTNTLVKPTLAELQQALTTIKNTARAGDEVTLYFSGHGGSKTFTDNTEANEPNNADEHFRLSSGNRLTDDALATNLQGLAAGVTLLVLMDSCYGGGFTGGASDLVEGPNVKVVGTKGTCPSEPWQDAFKFVTDTVTDSIFDTVVDGSTTGDDVKSGVEGDGFDLGPPEATTGDPQNGKSKCDDCTSLPRLTLRQEGIDGFLSGENFGADALVQFLQVTPTFEVFSLGTTVTGPSGTFEDEFVPLFLEPPFLIIAQDDQGFQDRVEVPQLIFSDGFESGDISAWSVSKP